MMNLRQKEEALGELLQVKNMLENVSAIFAEEKGTYTMDMRLNRDARLRQLSGLIRHTGYLMEYIEIAEVNE